MERTDLPFWRGLAARRGGRLLELGCGTGRVLLPLARQGYTLFGLDHDLGMLAFLKNHIPEDCTGSIHLLQADMANFRLGRRFPLILMPCNTLSTLTEEVRTRTLQRVYQHLSPGGIFASSLPNPDVLADLPAVGEAEAEECLVEPQSGQALQVSSEWEKTVNEFILRWHYDTLGTDGSLERRTVESRIGLTFPSRSRLYAFFHQECPECLSIWTQHKAVPATPTATAVHEEWQVDHQEGHRLLDGSIATVCNIRDPYGAAMIASQAFSVKTKRWWRKLTWEEVRQVLRAGFAEWQTLPDSVLTDNEMGLGGNPNDPFPSWLSLYLAGLGIKHNFIRSHRPTDQPQVERSHRTLEGLTEDERSRQDLASFQQSLDQERHMYNYEFPSRASDCGGFPPLKAHPFPPMSTACPLQGNK